MKMKMDKYYQNRITDNVLKVIELENDDFTYNLMVELKSEIPDLHPFDNIKQVSDFLLYNIEDVSNIRKFLFITENNLIIEDSDYSIEALGKSISQGSSYSNFSLSAFTAYKCKLCGEDKMHSNSNVPKLCIECGKSIAENIILYKHNILKR